MSEFDVEDEPSELTLTSQPCRSGTVFPSIGSTAENVPTGAR